MPTKLTPGQRAIKELANAVVTKATRLRNKASLVAGDPTPGRNLTALRNTALEMAELIDDLTARRCLACGCTDADCEGCVERTGDACEWVGPELCSACLPPEDPRGRAARHRAERAKAKAGA